MPPKIFALMLFLLAGFVPPLEAAVLFPALSRALPHAEKVGEASLSALFFDVYDIALFAPKGQWRADAPHALSVAYHLSLDAEDIVARSIEEMRRQNPEPARLQKWKEQLLAFFPAVEKGTVLSAFYVPGKKTLFYKDGELVGTIKDPAFGPVYMGIWLAEATSEPGMRAELLGKP